MYARFSSGFSTVTGTQSRSLSTFTDSSAESSEAKITESQLEAECNADINYEAIWI